MERGRGGGGGEEGEGEGEEDSVLGGLSFESGPLHCQVSRQPQQAIHRNNLHHGAEGPRETGSKLSSSPSVFSARQPHPEETFRVGPRLTEAATNTATTMMRDEIDAIPNFTKAGNDLGSTRMTEFTANQDLQILIQEKERELQEMNEYRMRGLEQALRSKDDQIQSLRGKFAKLSEDFNYNLKLIADRDAELNKYDTAFAKVKNIMHDKEAEIGDLRMHIDDLEAQLQTAAKKAEETHQIHERKLGDLRANMEGARAALEAKHRKERLALEEARLQLESRLRDKDDELEVQRREMADTYDELSRQKYADYEHRIEHLEKTIKDLESRLQDQIASLEREKSARKGAESRTKELDTQIAASEKRCKQLTWEVQDLQRLKDARIEELEEENKSLKDLKQQILDDHESKMTDLLSSLHSVEQAFVQQKNHYESQLQQETQKRNDALKSQTTGLEERLQALANKLRAAEDQLEASRADFIKAKWDYEDQLNVKQRELDTLKRKLESGDSQLETDVSKLRADLSERDREVQSIKNLLEAAKQDMAKHHERAVAAQREAEMARDATAEAERVLAEREVTFKHESDQRDAQTKFSQGEIVTSLQNQRDKLLQENHRQATKIAALESTVTELRAKVDGVQSELRSLWAKREYVSSGAVAPPPAPTTSLFDGDLGPPSPIDSPLGSVMTDPSAKGLGGTGNSEIVRLQEANMTLRREKDALASALRSMRSEMENMSLQLQPSTPASHRMPPSMYAENKAIISRPANDANDNENSTAENKLLHEQCKELLVYVKHLQSVVDAGPFTSLSAKDSNDAVSAEIKILRNIMRTQSEQLEFLRSQRGQSGPFKSQSQSPERRHTKTGTPNGVSSGDSVLEKENDRLKQQVIHLRAELKHVTEERDRLADLSNKLRAELKHASGNSVTNEQLEQVEKQVAATFQSKIRSVELALEQLVEQNRLLKKSLREVQSSHTDLNDKSDTHVSISQEDSTSLEIVGTAPPASSYVDHQRDDSFRQRDAMSLMGQSFESYRPSARERLEEARQRLQQAGRPPSAIERTQPPLLSRSSPAASSQAPPAAPPATKSSLSRTFTQTTSKPGQLQIGQHRIRNYNIRDADS